MAITSGGTIQDGKYYNPDNTQGTTANIPAGWDAITYANFKQANPNLEPNAQDTSIMQNSNPQIPSTINSSLINPNPAMVGATLPTPENTSGTLASLTPSAIINNQPVNPETANIRGTQKSLEDLIASLGGKTADQQAAEQATGVTDYTSQLNDINSQILALKAKGASLQTDANNIPLQQQQNAEGRGITAGGLAPLTAGELRKNAIQQNTITSQALQLSAQADALQGKLTSAQKKADQAVALKYAPIEANIKALQQQITDNMPFFDAAEKKQAEVVQAQLAERTRLLDNAKEDSKTGIAMVNAAIKNFPNDASAQYAAGLALQEAQKDQPDLNKIYSLIGQYQTDPIAVKKSILENQLVQSQINKNNADQKITTAENTDIPSVIANIKNQDESRSELGGLSVNGLIQKAKIYMANGGNIQGLGLSSTGSAGAQRTLIANYGAYLASQAGMDIPQISALYKANSKAAGEVVSRIAKIDTTSSTLTSQFPRLQQLAANVGNLGITESDLTKTKTELTRKFGSVDAANYIELLQTIRGDYAAMQAAIGGSRGGQFFQQTAQEAIPIGLTPEQYGGIADTIQTSAQLALLNSGNEAKSLLGITSNIGNGQTVQSNGQTYTVGQVYNDGTANWTIDAKGNWTKQ